MPRLWVMSTFWVLATATLGAVGVAAMAIHAVATLSLYSLLYAVLCGSMIYTWLTLRRHSEDTAAGADTMYLMALFLMLRVVEPAFAWLEAQL